MTHYRDLSVADLDAAILASFDARFPNECFTITHDHDAEEIRVLTSLGRTYTFTIGSDDDEMAFFDDLDDAVTVQIPE